MAENSNIEWCDSTINFWWGCTKVGPGCDNCYAEKWNDFRGNKLWGAGAPRTKIKGAVASIRKLNRAHPLFQMTHGRKRRVFVSSMSDIFDNEIDQAWRDEAFQEIEKAENLSIMLTTKRVTNIRKLVPMAWLKNWPQHVGVIITVVDQQEANRDIPRIVDLKKSVGIPWIGLSMEPLLSRVDLCQAFNVWQKQNDDLSMEWVKSAPCDVDWVIIGGESKAGARPMDPRWAQSIIRVSEAAGVAVLFKQWGEWAPTEACPQAWDGDAAGLKYSIQHFGNPETGIVDVHRVGKKVAGRTINGRTYDGFPEALL